MRFYVRECNVQDKIVWRIIDRDNSNVFMQLSDSLGATKIFTEKLLELALEGTSEDLLQKMYKQHCGKVNLLSHDAGTKVTTTERDFSFVHFARPVNSTLSVASVRSLIAEHVVVRAFMIRYLVPCLKCRLVL